MNVFSKEAPLKHPLNVEPWSRGLLRASPGLCTVLGDPGPFPMRLHMCLHVQSTEFYSVCVCVFNKNSITAKLTFAIYFFSLNCQRAFHVDTVALSQPFQQLCRNGHRGSQGQLMSLDCHSKWPDGHHEVPGELLKGF